MKNYLNKYTDSETIIIIFKIIIFCCFSLKASGEVALAASQNDIETYLNKLGSQKNKFIYNRILLNKLEEKKRLILMLKYGNEYPRTLSKLVNIKKEREKKGEIEKLSMEEKLCTNKQAFFANERELTNQSRILEGRLSTLSDTFYAKAGFIKPISGSIVSQFGSRKHPIFGITTFHSGIDINGRNNSPIIASNSGKVIYAGWFQGYGKTIIINHGKMNGAKLSTLYAHLSEADVKPGQAIHKGQHIGLEGTTGYSTGPHLHFEVRINGKPTNPLNYVKY